MGRLVGVGVAAVVGMVVALGSAWLTPTAGGGREKAAPRAGLDDLLRELQLVPLGGQPAKSFSLPAVDGRRVALADLKGRPALLYFWATW
jgi:cytochrome oxidase Cu insertion factor (SCO1/SenC/PrrC family)